MPTVESRFAHYLYGNAPAWALSDNPGFAYYAYVPRDLHPTGRSVPVLAIVHDTERRAETCRDRFAELAEEHNCIVIAPLFPCGLTGSADIDNYKRLAHRGTRYDLLLLQMVEQAAHRYELELGPVLLHGFSGGGQFAHRFYYLHPEALAAVSIGAPGAVTLVDDDRDWWVGTRDIHHVFDKEIDESALRSVRVQTIIGADDFGTEEVVVPPDSVHWMPDANHAGGDRQQRLKALSSRLQRIGVKVDEAVVPSVGHHWTPLLPSVKSFFADVLEGLKR